MLRNLLSRPFGALPKRLASSCRFMSTLPGDGSPEARLKQMVDEGEVETVIVQFTDLYGRQMGKRYDADFFLEEGIKGSHGCNYLVANDMDSDPVEGYRSASWTSGYGDYHIIPDVNTLRHCVWLDRTALVMCDLYDEDHNLVPHAPRSMLRLQEEKARSMGFNVQAASELEYYIYRRSYQEQAESHFTSLNPSGYYQEDYHILQGTRNEDFNGELRRALKYSGVPVDNTKGECGFGQHELNVKYAEVMEMADRHIVYKQAAKEIAMDMDMSVTFMAKPVVDQAGSSCHVHLSLSNENGENAFKGDKTIGTVEGCSDTFAHFLGGWMKYTPDIMVFKAPNINSYKRFVSGSWAPTRIAWSKDNRTAGFRIVGSGNSLRIECRIPGADVNPYTLFSAILAAGLKGVEDKIEPPPMFMGDVYQAGDNLLKCPDTLQDAVNTFRESEFALNTFGEHVHHHYTHFFQTEQSQFNQGVTDWERKRYFEQI